VPRDFLPASLLVALLVFFGCVPSEERVPDSADLRDPWELPGEPADPFLAVGKRVFAACASCHFADASGRPDGTIPRLAGQRASVLESRLRALSDGSVDLPVMTPFARALTETEIERVAAYLASLPRPERVGVGSGRQLERGAAVEQSLCVACHADGAPGQAALKAPRLCGQHAAYLRRRLKEIAGADPRAVDPAMRAIAVSLSSADVSAVTDHLSRQRCD
jgi:cytochrome c553